MHHSITRALLGTAAALMLLLAGCAADSPRGAAAVQVMLADGEGFTVSGQNPVSVPLGGTASFAIDMPPNSVCIQTTGGAVFHPESGTLTLSNVQYPATLTMRIAENPETYKFFLENYGNGGYVGADLEQGLVYEGAIAHCYVRVKPDFRFDGWSLRRSLAKGGKLVSTDENFEYTVEADTFLYANFTRVVAEAPKNGVRIPTMLFTYDTNGGVFAGTNVSIVNMDIPIHHIYQNCLPARDTFVRDGYQLIEYNTKADGTGVGYSLGSKVLALPTDPAPYLYCIWAKESDPSYFKYESVNGGVAVTEYTADEDTVVIPETLGGKKVVRIKTGAFVDKHFSTMVIPKSVRDVESAAFGCTGSFTTLYMFDTMQSIPDNAFTNTENFSNFRLNASQAPAYTNSTEGCFSIKWERMVAAENPVLLVLSGSSSLYGLNGAMLQSEIGEDAYTVVNFGTNAGVSCVFYMEVFSHFMDEGDIIVYAPEVGSVSMGDTNITWRLFRGTEYYYNVWRYVDMRHYTHLFSEFTAFQDTRRNMSSLDYYATTSSMNEYGDINNTTAYNDEYYHAGSNISLNEGVINPNRAAALEMVFDMLRAKGVTLYMSCAPCNYNAIVGPSRSLAVQDRYMASIQASISIPVISHIKNYILPGELMYNSDYHPNAWGRDLRTEQLIADLKAAGVPFEGAK